MSQENCEGCHYNWQVRDNKRRDTVTGEVIDLGKYITCLIDRKPHPISDKCNFWERIVSVHENQRLEDARVKRIEIASDKRSFKGMIIGGVIGVSGPVLIAIIKAFAG